MDWFDESEMPYHVYIYRRFIKSVRYIVLAHLVAATFVAFTFFIGGGSWVAGIVIAACVLAIGLYYIRHTPIHPHALMVRRAHVPHRRYETVDRRW
jgi:ribulose-5-phosphate 4-epimerase/fuculose-1-phosphate aldolase